MTDERKAEAEALRVGLLAGINAIDDAIRWADSVIESEMKPHPTIIEVALAGSQPINRVLYLLEQVPGEADRSDALKVQMRMMLSRLEGDPTSAEAVAQHLYRLAATGDWPSASFGDEAYWLDDTFDLVRQGIYRGTYADAVNELRGYLRRNSR